MDAVSDGTVHPLDAKLAVADSLSEILQPLSEYFERNPEIIQIMESITAMS